MGTQRWTRCGIVLLLFIVSYNSYSQELTKIKPTEFYPRILKISNDSLRVFTFKHPKIFEDTALLDTHIKLWFRKKKKDKLSSMFSSVEDLYERCSSFSFRVGERKCIGQFDGDKLRITF